MSPNRKPVRVPSTVAYLVLLLVLIGLYRHTAIGLDQTPRRVACQAGACGAMRPVALLPSVRSSDHLLVPLRIDGVPLYFLLDSGAATSVLSRSTAEELGWLGRTRTILGAINEHYQLQRVLPIGRLELGEAAFESFEMAVIDMSTIREALGRSVAGVLGTNVLGLQPFEIDLGEARLQLGRSAEEFALSRGPGEQDVAAPLQEIGGGYFVSGVVDGRVGWFLIDTGSNGSQIGHALAEHVARKTTVDVDVHDANAAGRERLVRAHPERLAVGGFVWRGVSVSVREPSLLGTDFLAGMLIRVDPERGEAVLRRRVARPTASVAVEPSSS